MLFHMITTSKAMNVIPASTKKRLISVAADPGNSRQTFGSVNGLQISGVFEIAEVNWKRSNRHLVGWQIMIAVDYSCVLTDQTWSYQ